VATAERTLSQRELNRALLARQLLLERARSSIPRALERIGGIQAQYAPSMYIGLWSRLEGFEREDLTRALQRRSVAQGTLVRQTIHLVSKRDYWPFAVAVREARRESWLSYTGGNRPGAKQMAAAARRAKPALQRGPMRRKQIDELLGGGSAMTNGLNMWLDLVRIPPSGTWERRRADLYALAEDWLGPTAVKRDEAVRRLVQSYLAGFGPASKKEAANYTGLPVKAIEPALKRLKVRRFRAEDDEELVDLLRAPLPAPDTPAPPRFLPTWDSTLLVHARRTGILPEEHRPKVFNVKTPQSTSTFLVEGEVAGTWRYEKGRVRLEPFGRLDASARRGLEQEAERLAAFHV
jgi:Winged helix DNA-binding domain